MNQAVVNRIGPIIFPTLTNTSEPAVAVGTSLRGDRRATSAMNAPFQPLAVEPRTKNSAHAAGMGQPGSAGTSRQVAIMTAASTASTAKQLPAASASQPQKSLPKTPPACEA